MQGTGRRRLEALDGLRGVAALAVVLLHVHLYTLLGMKPFSTHAYLAVDLFFMISGFILAHAYGDRLGSRRGLGDFMRARLLRLYPLYALGIALGFICFIALKPAELGAGGKAAVGLLSLSAAAFLPWLYGGAGVNAFPLNPPSWSLSLEMWGNLAYGALARHLAPRVLLAIVLISGGVLVALALIGGSLNYGWRQDDVWLGWPRFVFAFSVGLGLHQLAAAGRLELRRLPDWSLALALGAILILPAGNSFDAAVDLTAVLLVFPTIVALAVDARSTATWRGPLAAGARLSYPLYVVHAAVVAAVHEGARGLGASAAAGWFIAALALGLSVLAAWLAERYFDRPIRARLSRFGRPAVPAAARSAI